MQKGYLLVRTYIADKAVPVRGARVTVTSVGDDGESLVAFRVTDKNGKTDLITLDTPDRQLSLEQENSQTPFALFKVKVEKEGFIKTVINDVQVFADSLSEQNVEMIVLPENYNSGNLDNTFTITPQNL